MNRSARTSSGNYWADVFRESIDELAGFWLFEAVTGRDRFSWDHSDQVTRLSWIKRAQANHDFIPSQAPKHEEVHQAVIQSLPQPEDPAHPVLLDSPEFYALPSSVEAMRKRLDDNGWSWMITGCTGPWPKKIETVKIIEVNDDGEEVETGVEERIKYGQAESYVIRFRRCGMVGWAMWYRRPWLKDPKFSFYGAQVRPSVGKISSPDLIKLLKESQ